MRSLLVCISAVLFFVSCASNPKGSSLTVTDVPAIFEDGHLYLKATINEKQLKMLLDSGGGLKPFTYVDVVQEKKLPFTEFAAVTNGVIGKTSFGEANAPLGTLFMQMPPPLVYNLEDPSSEAIFIRKFVGNGFVGATFFGRKTWVIDYINGKLGIAEGKSRPTKGKVLATFKVDQKGNRTTNQPLIPIEVAGKKLAVLFDTGATSWLSKDAQKIRGIKEEFPSSSFIRKSIYEAWRKANPTWRVIEKGERFNKDKDLIEVPEVKIGDVTVGPVWFAVRDDDIYNRYGPVFFGSHCDGAIGGSALKYLRVTADYETGSFYFER